MDTLNWERLLPPTLDVVLATDDAPLAVRVHLGRLADHRTTSDRGGDGLVADGQGADARRCTPPGWPRRGFTAVTFDFAGFGASGGEPAPDRAAGRARWPTSPPSSTPAGALVGRPRAVGLLAVCASAQYALGALARGLPVACLGQRGRLVPRLRSVAPLLRRPDGRGATGWREAAPALRGGRRAPSRRRTAPGTTRAGMSLEMDYYASPARGAVPSGATR